MSAISNIKRTLIDDAEYSPERVEKMDGYDLIDAWLEWEGIIGYTSDIISAVLQVHDEYGLEDWRD